MALQLGRKNARWPAVQAQLIHATRPADLVELVDRLTLLQIDPTAAIAPNADQVPGVDSKSHQSAELTRVLEERARLELRAFVRPMSCRRAPVPRGDGCTANVSMRGSLDANDGFRPK